MSSATKVFNIVELRNIIFDYRTDLMLKIRTENYIKYIQSHPYTYFYNYNSNILIRKYHDLDNVYYLYKVFPTENKIVFQRTMYIMESVIKPLSGVYK